MSNTELTRSAKKNVSSAQCSDTPAQGSDHLRMPHDHEQESAAQPRADGNTIRRSHDAVCRYVSEWNIERANDKQVTIAQVFASKMDVGNRNHTPGPPAKASGMTAQPPKSTIASSTDCNQRCTLLLRKPTSADVPSPRRYLED